MQLPESSPTPGGEQALQDEGCGHSELGGQGGRKEDGERVSEMKQGWQCDYSTSGRARPPRPHPSRVRPTARGALWGGRHRRADLALMQPAPPGPPPHPRPWEPPRTAVLGAPRVRRAAAGNRAEGRGLSRGPKGRALRAASCHSHFGSGRQSLRIS